jgi:hypothetical protein
MVEAITIQPGMVLQPVQQVGREQRLCVLLDMAAPLMRLRVARRDAEGDIQLTEQEFLLPPSALEMLRPVPGLFCKV